MIFTFNDCLESLLWQLSSSVTVWLAVIPGCVLIHNEIRAFIGNRFCVLLMVLPRVCVCACVWFTSLLEMTLTVKTHCRSSHSNELMSFCESRCCSTPKVGIKGITVISASKEQNDSAQVWTRGVWMAAPPRRVKFNLSLGGGLRRSASLKPSVKSDVRCHAAVPPTSLWVGSSAPRKKHRLIQFGLNQIYGTLSRARKTQSLLLARATRCVRVRACTNEFWQLRHPLGRRADTLSPTTQWKDNLSRTKDKMWA